MEPELTKSEAKIEKKCSEPSKVATRWLPRPPSSTMVTPLDTFLGPPWDPKNHEKSFFFSQKSRPRKCVFINFCSECRQNRQQIVQKSLKINQNAKKLDFLGGSIF